MLLLFDVFMYKKTVEILCTIVEMPLIYEVKQFLACIQSEGTTVSL
jgi:hypothetical protein